MLVAGAGPKWNLGLASLNKNPTVVRAPLNGCTANDYMSVSGSILRSPGVRDTHNHGQDRRDLDELHPSLGLRQSFRADCNKTRPRANELSQITGTVSVSGGVQRDLAPQLFAVCAGVDR